MSILSSLVFATILDFVRIQYLALVLPFLLISCKTFETYVPPEERKPEHHYNKPRLQGRVGMRKLNPVWWVSNADRDYDSWWKPDQPHWYRKLTFQMRNPGHNFTHYVIGVADRDFVRTGLAANDVWHEADGKLGLAMTHAGILHLPFVSRRGKFIEAYAGWRQAGNFGLALRRSKRD